MLVIASPIYYHGISVQLKCTIDRFYSAAYPKKPWNLKKAAMILSSGAPKCLGLEDMAEVVERRIGDIYLFEK